jgi:hypothetical protein
MEKVYVHCKVLLGLFDTELYVLVNGSLSAYVGRSEVRTSVLPTRGNQVDGQVLAYRITQEKDRSLIEVPGEAVVGGLRTWVPNKMLASA